MRGYPQFSFWISITLVKIYSSCIIINRGKNTFELVGTVLKFLKFCRLFSTSRSSAMTSAYARPPDRPYRLSGWRLRRGKCASVAPWVRFFGKSIRARNFDYDVSVRPPAFPYRLSGWRWLWVALGIGVFGQVSLAGNRMANVAFGNPRFSGRKSQTVVGFR